MRTALVISLVGAALVSGACETDDVIRHVTLETAVELPGGSSALVGDTLIVEFEGVEPLAADRRFVVWAETEDGEVALDATATARELEVDLTSASLTGADVAGVAISEEPDDSELPTSATQIILEGIPGRELEFAGIEAHDLEGLSGTAELHNDEIHVMAMGLPPLPDHCAYSVWLMFEAGGHGHDDGHDDMLMLRVGDLDGAGILETTGDRMLAAASSVTVTVETANGVDMMSPSTMLSGQVVFEGEGGADEGGAHGGHMH